MSQKVIIDVQANTSTATENIEETTAALNKLTQSQENLDTANTKTASSFEDVTKNGGAIALLDSLTGGLASRIRDTYEASKLFNLSLLGTKKALIATGIGAFIVALGTVVAYWDEIKGFITGANKALERQQKILDSAVRRNDAYLSLIRQSIAEDERLGKTTELKIKTLREGLAAQISNSRKEIEAIKKSLDEQSYLYENDAEKRDELKIRNFELLKNILTLETEERKLNEKEEAERQAAILADEEEQIRFAESLREEESKRKKERRELDDKLREASINNQEELRAEEIKQVENQYNDLLKEARKYYRSDSEQVQELLTSKQEKIVALETKFAEEDEIRRKEKEAEDERIRLEKEAKEEEQRKKQEARQKKIEEKRKKERQKEIDDAKAVAEAKEKIRNAELDNIANGVALLSKLAPKSKALQAASIIASNAVGIAKIVQQTAAANTAAKLKYALLPGGAALAAAEIAANKVSAGLNIATSVAATAKGLSTLKSGGSASTSFSLPSESTGGGVAQEPQFNIVGQGAGSQIAAALGQQQQQPIQAYVVSQDITTAQSLENGIIQGATLGG